MTSATSPLIINSSGVLSLALSGLCTAATSPLTLQNGQMTIDLTSYSTTTQMNTAITTALTNYVTNTALTNSVCLYRYIEFDYITGT